MKIIDQHGREIETDMRTRVDQLEAQVAELSRALNMMAAAHSEQITFNQRQLGFNQQVVAALNSETLQ